MRRMYTPENIRELKEKARKALIASGIIGAVTLLGCVLLCIGIRTANAALRQGLVIGLTVLGAGVIIWLLEGIRLPALREAAHEEGVLRENAEPHQGQIMQIGAPHPIPRSITFIPVTIREGEKELSLKLNAICAKSFPVQGAWICAETRRGYLVSWMEEPADAAETMVQDECGSNPETSQESASLHAGNGRDEKNTFAAQVNSEKSQGTVKWSRAPLGRLIRHAILCLAAGALLWSWIFTFLTDTDAANKIVLYADMREGRWQELSIQLEENAPEGIRFVQVHPFSYALMDSTALERSDLYIMTAAQAEEYMEWIVPLPEDYQGDAVLNNPEGEPVGLLIYDAETGECAAGEYLNYEEEPGADWYLFFGAQSLHAGEQDDAAIRIAEEIMKLP